MSEYAEYTRAVEKNTQELSRLNQNLANFFTNSKTINPPTSDTVPLPDRLTPRHLSKIIGASLPTIYSRASKDSKNPFPFPVSRCGRLLKFDRAAVMAAMTRGEI